MPGTPSQNLLLEVKAGNKAAFAELYDAYSAALFGVAVKVVGDEAQAADVLQDSFVKIWRYAPKYDPKKGSAFTWMLNIARNTAIDALRKSKKATLRPIQNEDAAVDKKASSEQNTDTIGLKSMVADLPEEQQIIVEYLYFKGYTQQETSDALNLPLGTVKTRSRAALKKMAKLFNS